MSKSKDRLSYLRDKNSLTNRAEELFLHGQTSTRAHRLSSLSFLKGKLGPVPHRSPSPNASSCSHSAFHAEVQGMGTGLCISTDLTWTSLKTQGNISCQDISTSKPSNSQKIQTTSFLQGCYQPRLYKEFLSSCAILTFHKPAENHTGSLYMEIVSFTIITINAPSLDGLEGRGRHSIS